jgi:hypothetical protein
VEDWLPGNRAVTLLLLGPNPGSEIPLHNAYFLRFEVFIAVTMKNAFPWILSRVTLVAADVSEERTVSTIRATRIGELRTILYLRIVLRLLATANVASSPILVTLMMEAVRSSDMSVLTRVALRNISEDCILQFLRFSQFYAPHGDIGTTILCSPVIMHTLFSAM